MTASAAAIDQVEELAERALDDACEDIAVHQIAKACAQVIHQRAMASAIIRRATWLYARLTSFAEADRQLTQLARQMRDRASKQPGQRRGML